MDVLIVLVFVSLVLVLGSVLLFLFTLHQHDFEHGERLSLLPILDPNDDHGRADGAQPDPMAADVADTGLPVAVIPQPLESTRS